MKALKSQGDMVEFHLGLGMWIRNNWGLWSDGRLYRAFAKLGLAQPDDMSGLILEEYWRHLHGLAYDTNLYVSRIRRFYEANGEPVRPRKCPWDHSEMEVYTGISNKELVKGHIGTVWFCRCERGHLWAWFYKKGWFRPTGALLKEFNAHEAALARERRG